MFVLQVMCKSFWEEKIVELENCRQKKCKILSLPKTQRVLSLGAREALPIFSFGRTVLCRQRYKFVERACGERRKKREKATAVGGFFPRESGEVGRNAQRSFHFCRKCVARACASGSSPQCASSQLVPLPHSASSGTLML